MTEELIMRKDLLNRGKWCECLIRQFLPDNRYLKHQYFKCKLLKSVGFPAYVLQDVWKMELKHKDAFIKKKVNHECQALSRRDE